MNGSSIAVEIHEQIADMLKYRVMNDRIVHAYLFAGDKGMGKKVLARFFAHSLVCFSPDFNGACNVCPACRLFLNSTNADCRETEPEGSSIGVDQIKKLFEDVNVKPLYSKRKVYSIFEADKMTVQAQNSLLKILEEPPRHVVILLTASNYESLLDTVKSRVVRINIKPVSPKIIFEQLAAYRQDENYKYFVSLFSGGNPGKAKIMMESEKLILLRHEIIEGLYQIVENKTTSLVSANNLQKIIIENKEDIEFILEVMTTFARDVIVALTCAQNPVLINYDKKGIIFESAKRLNLYSMIAFTDTIYDMFVKLKRNVNFQLLAEVVFATIMEVLTYD